MTKSKKRDAAYWRGRLEREHPAIYARFLDGTISSVHAACAEAGLIRLPTRSDALIREWKKASPSERKTFIDWLKASCPPRPSVTPPVALVDADDFLTCDAIERIKKAKVIQGFHKQGQLMEALGVSKLDASLGLAMRGYSRLRRDLVDRLQKWLDRVEKS